MSPDVDPSSMYPDHQFSLGSDPEKLGLDDIPLVPEVQRSAETSTGPGLTDIDFGEGRTSGVEAYVDPSLALVAAEVGALAVMLEEDSATAADVYHTWHDPFSSSSPNHVHIT